MIKLNEEDIKALSEERDIPYRGDDIRKLSEEEFQAGARRINLQDIDNLDSLNGEGCWGWYSEEDRKRYDNNEYGTATCILLNSPIDYMGVLFWGSELKIKLNETNRPTLDKEWVKEKILGTDWFRKFMSEE